MRVVRFASETWSVRMVASNAPRVFHSSRAYGITMSRVYICYARVINSTANTIQYKDIRYDDRFVGPDN